MTGAEHEETTAPTTTRTRMAPEQRKAHLRRVARAVFAERGYAASGLAEIADRANVSKTLLYHYYAEGRPELFAAVLDDLVGELLRATRVPLSAPFDAARRLEGFVDAFLGYFEHRPDAFRLLFREPLGSGDPVVVQRGVDVLVTLSLDLAGLLASFGAEAEVAMTATAGTVGFLVAVADAVLAGQIPRDRASAIASQFLLGGIRTAACGGEPPASRHPRRA
jgi:AcrR family transcriptional regulator